MPKMKNVDEGKPVENPPGVIRKTLSYNNEAMLCHFLLHKGAKIPLHNHRATQIGYIVKGKGRKESFESCSHGAGRVMGRKEAYKTLSL